jgi:outer membrane protein TolC
LTLRDCINAALGRSPQLEAERHDLEASKEAIWKERADLLPRVTAASSALEVNGTPVTPFAVLHVNNPDEGSFTQGSSTKASSKKASSTKASKTQTRVDFGTVGTASAMVSYPLFQNGSILGLNDAPAVGAAKAVYKRQEWTMRLSEQAVIYRLIGPFYNAIAYRQKVELDQRRVVLSKDRLMIMKEELALDLKLPKDVELARAQLAADQQSLATSQQRALDSAVLLAQLIGRPLHQKLNLDLSEPHIPATPPLEDFLNRVTAKHPAIEVQRAEIEVARQNLRLAQSALLPTVKLESSYTLATDFSPPTADLFLTALRADVPVFDFGHGQAAARESRDKLNAAQARLGQVNLDLRASIISVLSEIHSTESTIAGLDRDYVQTKNNVELITAQRRLGMIDQLAIVDAEMAFLAAKDALILARLAQRLEYAQLQNLAGGVWNWIP